MSSGGRLRFLWWTPAIFWAAAIFFFSGQSSHPVTFPGVSDYVLHFAAYGLLASFCALGFSQKLPLGLPARLAMQSWLLATLYGVTDEFHQAFTPGRNPSWGDILADSLGALCAVLILRLLRFRAS